ncbi:MAG: amidohydrolase family protein [Erythrobacter sp.]
MFSSLLLATLAMPVAAQDIYHGVTIFDPATETVTPDSYILVDEGQIVAVGIGRPADRDGAKLHDMTGLWALPGLIDTHAHLTLGPTDIRVEDGVPIMRANSDEAIIEHGARMLLSYGVTTIRNTGGAAAENARYAEQVAAKERLGPEMIWASEIIDRGPFAFENLVTRVQPDHGVADIVSQQAATDARYVKLYTGLDRDDLVEGIAAAHAHDMRVIGHLGDASWTDAAELGIDAIVHAMPTSPDLLPEDRRDAYLANRRQGPFQFFEWFEAAELDAPEITGMIASLARNDVAFDATLVAFEPTFFGDDEALLAGLAAHAHPAMVENWRGGFRFDAGWQADDYARAQAVWPKVLELVRLMFEGGVPMTIGTDFANPFVAPGLSMSREMVLH